MRLKIHMGGGVVVVVKEHFVQVPFSDGGGVMVKEHSFSILCKFHSQMGSGDSGGGK